MKKFNDNDPASLYRDCWEYVVACTMANCPHLSREEAEDITSNAFVELYLKRKTNIQNWVWTAKMRGRWDFKTRNARYNHVGISANLPDTRVAELEFFEVFKLRSLLVRKDAKACYDLAMNGYTSAEIAEILHRRKHGVAFMFYRLRKQAKKYIANDIKLYSNAY